jgi:hypothetical protein
MSMTELGAWADEMLAFGLRLEASDFVWTGAEV